MPRGLRKRREFEYTMCEDNNEWVMKGYLEGVKTTLSADPDSLAGTGGH